MVEKMGSKTARDLNEEVLLDNVKLEVALEYHLTGNHYPPISTSLIPACIQAINNGNNGELDLPVELPNGKILSTGEIISALHLEWFVKYEK